MSEQHDDDEPWSTVEVDDETIEKLRRLLFDDDTAPVKS